MNKELIKKILIGILFLCLIVSNVITLKLYLVEQIPDDNKKINETADEISRIKFFIKDWYDELSIKYSNLEVYNNELRFNKGTYPLTIVNNRIRAVYPRGERYFQMEYVTYGEFYRENNFLFCRLYFDDTGEYVFKIN